MGRKDIRGRAIGNLRSLPAQRHQVTEYYPPCVSICLRRPTLDCVSWRGLAPSFGLITDPLLTALPPDFDPAWVLAPHPRRLGLCAKRHTADGAVHTHTLVFTAGLEALPVTVDHAIMFAARSHHIWQREMTSSHILYGHAKHTAN